MTNETLIAVISSAAAIISAFAAWKALRIVETDYRERHDDIKIYLIDGLSWNSPSNEKYVLFALSFTNSANAPDSLVRIEVKVHVYDTAGNLSHVILGPTPELITEIVPWQLEPLKSSINLAPRNTVSGWVGFKLPMLFSENRSVDRYELIGITASGNKISVESYLLRKVIDER